jgi:ribosomal protein S18 acetylase RimI-like enzyme
MSVSSTIHVRTARPDEAPSIASFQIAMARETESLELPPEIIARGVRAVFDDPSKGRYWMAELDGEVAGGLLTTFEWSDWRAATVVWIQSVYVRPEFRGRGVYRALYEHLVARVEDDPGLAGIRLYVERANRSAQAVYERLGMTREHYDLYEWLKP